MKQKRKTVIPPLSPIAARTLMWLLAPVAAVLVTVAFTTASLDTYEAIRQYPLLADKIEHILMSLLIAVGGSLALDISLKRR